MRPLLVLILLLSTGCVKRTLSITTTPSNALVWLNDREVGRTPLEIEFLYYGEYDVRIQHVDSESLMTTRWVKSPWWDMPFVDLAAEAMPFDLNANPVWHFDLQPRNNNLDDLVQRANSFRLKETDQ
ncbi:MAG: PEGA domain-containing protein [Planctomycetes bacterium]|nr:PEGA domain-containing protein [Planctomycetota bacterium]